MTIVDQLLSAAPPRSARHADPRRGDAPTGAFAAALSDVERSAASTVGAGSDSAATDTEPSPSSHGGIDAARTGRTEAEGHDEDDATGTAPRPSADALDGGTPVSAHQPPGHPLVGGGDDPPASGGVLEEPVVAQRTTVPFGIRHLVSVEDRPSGASEAAAADPIGSIGQDLVAPAAAALDGANASDGGATVITPRIRPATLSPSTEVAMASSTEVAGTNPVTSTTVPIDAVDGEVASDSIATTMIAAPTLPESAARAAAVVASPAASSIGTADGGAGPAPSHADVPPTPATARGAVAPATITPSAGAAAAVEAVVATGTSEPTAAPAPDQVARIVLDRMRLAAMPTPVERAGGATPATDVAAPVGDRDVVVPSTAASPPPTTGPLAPTDGSTAQLAPDATDAPPRVEASAAGVASTRTGSTPPPTETTTTGSATSDAAPDDLPSVEVGADRAGRRVVVRPAEPGGSSDDVVAPELRTPDAGAPRHTEATAVARGTEHTGRAAEQLAWRELFDRIERQRSSLDGGLELEIVTERFGTIRVEAAEARDGIHLSLRGDGAGHRELAELAAELRQQFGRGGGAFADVDVDDGSGSTTAESSSAADERAVDDPSDAAIDGSTGSLDVDDSGLDLHL